LQAHARIESAQSGLQIEQEAKRASAGLTN
jgi:hypothetical protein